MCLYLERSPILDFKLTILFSSSDRLDSIQFNVISRLKKSKFDLLIY